MAQLWANNASALLQEDISPFNTSLRVQIGFGYLFPQPTNPDDFFLVTLENSIAPVEREIIRVAGRSGDYLTSLTRGWEGTAPKVWSAGNTLVDHRLTAGSILAMDGASMSLVSENATPSTPAPVAYGTNSIAIGSNARSNQAGQLAWTSGQFSQPGDSQLNRFALRGTTISDEPVRLFLPDSSSIIVPEHSTSTFKVMITARQVGGSNHLGIEFHGVLYRGQLPTSVIFQGKPTKWVLSRSSSWDANISLDPGDGALVITANGQNGVVIRWFAVVELVSIAEITTTV